MTVQDRERLALEQQATPLPALTALFASLALQQPPSQHPGGHPSAHSGQQAPADAVFDFRAFVDAASRDELATFDACRAAPHGQLGQSQTPVSLQGHASQLAQQPAEAVTDAAGTPARPAS